MFLNLIFTLRAGCANVSSFSVDESPENNVPEKNETVSEPHSWHLCHLCMCSENPSTNPIRFRPFQASERPPPTSAKVTLACLTKQNLCRKCNYKGCVCVSSLTPAWVSNTHTHTYNVLNTNEQDWDRTAVQPATQSVVFGHVV